MNAMVGRCATGVRLEMTMSHTLMLRISRHFPPPAQQINIPESYARLARAHMATAALTATARHHLLLPRPPPLYIHASSRSQGLSTLLRALDLSAPHLCVVDLVRVGTGRALFSAILSASPTSNPVALDLPAFVAALKCRPVNAIVLLRADRFVSAPPHGNVLHVLCNLSNLVGRSIAVFLLAPMPWKVFRARIGHSVAAGMSHCRVPASTKAELLHALRKEGQIVWNSYVDAVVDVVWQSTRQPAEIGNVVNALWEGYQNVYQKDGAVKAFNHLLPRLAAWLKGANTEIHVVPTELIVNKERIRLRAPMLRKNQGFTLQMAALLTAAYLAARNPPKLDLKYFSVERTGRGRKSTTGKGVNVEFNVFPLERWLAIYQAIREHHMSSQQCLETVATLVKMGYVGREGTDVMVESRYRCLVSMQQAEAFAHMAGIQLHYYLHI